MHSGVSPVYPSSAFIDGFGLEAYGLQGPEAYAYTSLSNCLEVQGIDDVQDFGDTIVRVTRTKRMPLLTMLHRKPCKLSVSATTNSPKSSVC